MKGGQNDMKKKIVYFKRCFEKTLSL